MRLIKLLSVCLCLSLAFPALAQTGEEEDGIEINLDALESISPAREEPAPPAPETDSDEEDGSDAPLLPPGVEDDQSKGPPDLTRPPVPVLTSPNPQTPSAPRASSLDAVASRTSPALARSLQDRVDQVLFDAGEESLTLSGTEQLDAIVAHVSETAVRLELHAYGGTRKQSPSETKRLSLNRAIAVRGYLMGKGIDGTRIALRPKGPADKNEPPERVDIHFLVP